LDPLQASLAVSQSNPGMISCCQLLLLAISGAVGQDPNSLDLTMFDESTGALCIDGSIGGFHARNRSKTSIVISLPGGGWCWDDDTCGRRANTSLGSSTKYIAQRGRTMGVGEGELSGDPKLNPHFYGFTAISPIYCDGSNYAGAADRTVGGVTLHIRGRKILQAMLDVLLKDWSYDETLEEVVLSGCSAGGTGVYFNVDWIHSYIQSQLKHTKPLKTRAFGNAGWFLDANSKTWDGDAWNQVPGIQRRSDKQLFEYANLKDTLSKECQRSYAPIDESWKCAMSQYLYPFIEQPTLVLQSSYDLNQIATGGPPCLPKNYQNGVPKMPFSNCTADQIEQMSKYGDSLNASMFIARHGAVFAPTCVIHCYTGHWTSIAINNVTMADAIGEFAAADEPSGMLWYDTCRGPNCNPSCPNNH
jgi:hypothetical protein